MTQNNKIKQSEKDAIIQSLRIGVVPNVGLQHIQVGRKNEINALINDIKRIENNSSAFRLIIGRYGAGKTFFLNLIKTIAHKHKLAVMKADLSPDKRLYSTSGHARALYSEAIKNLSTTSKPNGGAFESLLESFMHLCIEENDGTMDNVEEKIKNKLKPLHDLVDGYDFANVILLYCKAYKDGNDEVQNYALKWLKGEYTTKLEANKNLGVRCIIEDSKVYDYIKLISKFSVIAGRSGLLVIFDEMVNIYKLSNTKVRTNNHEQILRMINDLFQGGVENLGIIMGGTPDFLTDAYRGLYSYEALKSRLEENNFLKGDLIDFEGPIIRLSELGQEDMFILLKNINNVFSSGFEKSILEEKDIEQFMIHCNKKIGAQYFKTPRNTIKEFINLLSILEQNKSIALSDVIDKIEIGKDEESTQMINEQEASDDLATFDL